MDQQPSEPGRDEASSAPDIIRMVPPPRVRPAVIVGIIVLSTLAVGRPIPQLAGEGAWDAVILLLFGIIFLMFIGIMCIVVFRMIVKW